MSNVLIGIIGVILFIGLALAGALILGDDFRSSKNESRASAIAAQMQQVSSAINMYELKTGTPFAAGSSLTLLMPRYLKSVPVNPTDTKPYLAYGPAGQGNSSPVGLVLLELSNEADEICNAIARQTTGEDFKTAASPAAFPTGPVGCFKTTVAIWSLKAATHYAYART